MLALIMFLAPCVGVADSRDIDQWVASELADYVAEQLSTIPRFAAASVQFVAFADGQPAPLSNALALSLRDNLRRSLAGRKLRLGWQPDPAATPAQAATSAEQCEAMQPELLVGIEVQSRAGDNAFASVRALDESSRRWVKGFGLEWQGRLSARQYRDYRTVAADRAFLGRREVPFEASETDLIANHLARDLRCQLMRQVAGEYRLAAPETPVTGEALASVPALVRHQVGGVSSLMLLSANDDPNAKLRGMLHPIAQGLHQYWLVLDPVRADEGLQPLSTSVYVQLDVLETASGSERGGVVVPSPAAKVLSDMRVVGLSGNSCVRAGALTVIPGRWQGNTRCAALRVTAASDAVIFILNHQRNFGLVRLGDNRCEPRARAHVLRRGQSISIPVPDLVAVDDAEWSAVSLWSASPASDVFYAIASGDSEAAHALAKRLAALPARCSESVRPGLDGAALTHWLRGFAAELERRANDVDWLAIQARSVL